MIGRIIDFRLRQTARLFKDIGAVYLVLLLVVCLGFFLGIVESLIRSESFGVGLIGIMIVASIHFSRKDAGFLKKLELDRRKLYMWEYLLITLPLIFAFLAGTNYGAILVQIIGILIVAFLPNPEISSYSFSNKFDFKYFPLAAFEAKSYMRRMIVPFVIIYSIGLLTSFYITIPFLAIIMMALFFTAFFDEVEGKDLIEAIHFKKGILKTKVKTYLGLFYMMLLPYVVSFLIFHLQYWYLLLATIFVTSTIILFNIFYKYAHFTPHRRRVNNSLANAIFFGSVIIPFFYPVTLLYLFYYWRKARKNIRLYYAED